MLANRYIPFLFLAIFFSSCNGSRNSDGGPFSGMWMSPTSLLEGSRYKPNQIFHFRDDSLFIKEVGGPLIPLGWKKQGEQLICTGEPSDRVYKISQPSEDQLLLTPTEGTNTPIKLRRLAPNTVKSDLLRKALEGSTFRISPSLWGQQAGNSITFFVDEGTYVHSFTPTMDDRPVHPLTFKNTNNWWIEVYEGCVFMGLNQLGSDKGIPMMGHIISFSAQEFSLDVWHDGTHYRFTFAKVPEAEVENNLLGNWENTVWEVVYQFEADQKYTKTEGGNQTSGTWKWSATKELVVLTDAAKNLSIGIFDTQNQQLLLDYSSADGNTVQTQFTQQNSPN